MFDNINYIDYQYYIDISNISYAIFVSLLLLVLCFNVYILRHKASKAIFPTYFLSLIVVIFLLFSFGSDKLNYYNMFKDILYSGFDSVFGGFYDTGWTLILYIISIITPNELFFFFIIALFYVLLNLCFCLKQTSYPIYMFIAVVSSLGFFSYGVNTIRAGLSLGFVLMAILYVFKFNIIFLLFSFFAIMIHKSAAILVISIIISRFYNNSKKLIFLWVICLIISVISGDYFRENFIIYFGDFDSRVSAYLGDNDVLYNSGFRWDFLLYSLAPIIVGFYNIVEKRNVDKMYILLYNVYLLTNAFWLLLITVPFSDRFAYLSWFLYPYILLLPYLKDSNPQIKKVGFIIMILAIFNIFQLVSASFH